MYRDAVIGVLISAFTIMLLDLVLRLVLRGRKVTAPQRPSPRALRPIRIIVNLFGLLSFVAAAASGFDALLIDSRKLVGYGLLVHVGAAPAFTIGAVLVTLFWAHRNRFNPADWSRVRRSLGLTGCGVASSYAVLLRKISFWVAAVLAAPAALSTTTAMFPFWDPSRQETLFLIHRCCVLPLAAAGLFFAYFAFVSWLEGSAD